MRFGKLSSAELTEHVLSKLSVKNSEVLLAAGLGEDCAAILADGQILITADPITAPLPLYELGALLVDVCCNDIAANGGVPLALTVTVIMPPDSDAAEVGKIMDGASKRADACGVDIVGGHTEFSDCVTRPIVSGTAFGRARRVLKKTDLKVGDRLFVTKQLATEGTVLIADAYPELLSKEERAAVDATAKRLSVIAESKLLSLMAEVTMMHDVTEGGIIGAVAEVTAAAKLGAVIDESTFPFSDLTRRLCAARSIDPSRLVSSGSMLFSSASDAPKEALCKNGFEVTEIGVVTAGQGTVLKKASGETVRVEAGSDEMYKIGRQ